MAASAARFNSDAGEENINIFYFYFLAISRITHMNRSSPKLTLALFRTGTFTEKKPRPIRIATRKLFSIVEKSHYFLISLFLRLRACGHVLDFVYGE